MKKLMLFLMVVLTTAVFSAQGQTPLSLPAEYRIIAVENSPDGGLAAIAYRENIGEANLFIKSPSASNFYAPLDWLAFVKSGGAVIRPVFLGSQIMYIPARMNMLSGSELLLDLYLNSVSGGVNFSAQKAVRMTLTSGLPVFKRAYDTQGLTEVSVAAAYGGKVAYWRVLTAHQYMLHDGRVAVYLEFDREMYAPNPPLRSMHPAATMQVVGADGKLSELYSAGFGVFPDSIYLRGKTQPIGYLGEEFLLKNRAAGGDAIVVARDLNFGNRKMLAAHTTSLAVNTDGSAVASTGGPLGQVGLKHIGANDVVTDLSTPVGFKTLHVRKFRKGTALVCGWKNYLFGDVLSYTPPDLVFLAGVAGPPLTVSTNAAYCPATELTDNGQVLYVERGNPNQIKTFVPPVAVKPTITTLTPNPVETGKEYRVEGTGKSGNQGEVYVGSSFTNCLQSLPQWSFGCTAPAMPGEYSVQLRDRVSGLMSDLATLKVVLPPPVKPIPAVNEGGVVNAASYELGSTPGGILAIFGSNLAGGIEKAPNMVFPLPTTMQKTQVIVDGRALPLFYVSPKQVNAQWPMEMAPNTTSRLQVIFDGERSAEYLVRTYDAAPGVFQTLETGFGPIPGAIAMHVDYDPVKLEDPALLGEEIALICTGLGYAPGIQTGMPSTPSQVVNEVKVTIDGREAKVTWAGYVATLTGLNQVNFVVPADLGPSNLPVRSATLQAGGRTTNFNIVVVAR